MGNQPLIKLAGFQLDLDGFGSYDISIWDPHIPLIVQSKELRHHKYFQGKTGPSDLSNVSIIFWLSMGLRRGSRLFQGRESTERPGGALSRGPGRPLGRGADGRRR